MLCFAYTWVIRVGYREQFDPQVMADINAVWQFEKKKDKNKAKLYKFKIVDGGKNDDK